VKRRRYNTLGRRILAMLAPSGGGPRKRTVLLGIAGSEKKLRRALERLIAAGRVVVKGKKRGTLYALGKSVNPPKESIA
jgi:hypothetical protein